MCWQTVTESLLTGATRHDAGPGTADKISSGLTGGTGASVLCAILSRVLLRWSLGRFSCGTLWSVLFSVALWWLLSFKFTRCKVSFLHVLALRLEVCHILCPPFSRISHCHAVLNTNLLPVLLLSRFSFKTLEGPWMP